MDDNLEKITFDITKLSRVNIVRHDVENMCGSTVEFDKIISNNLPVIVEELPVGPPEVMFKAVFVIFFDRVDLLVRDKVVLGQREYRVYAVDRRGDGTTVAYLGCEWCVEHAKTVGVGWPE